METATLHDDLLAGQLARNQFGTMSDHCGPGKPRDVTVGNPHRAANLVGKEPEPGPEHDGDLGAPIAQPLANRLGRRLYWPGCTSLHLLRPLRHLRPLHSRIPAIVAERKLARVPASIARMPSWAR